MFDIGAKFWKKKTVEKINVFGLSLVLKKRDFTKIRAICWLSVMLKTEKNLL